MGATVRLHICGNITHLLPGIATLPIHILDVDHMVDMATAREAIGSGVVFSGNIDPLDVMFIRSINKGLTWSTPVRVNDDPTDNEAWQWFGTMSVAPNGRIDVIWNDTRNDPTSNTSELFYSFRKCSCVRLTLKDKILGVR